VSPPWGDCIPLGSSGTPLSAIWKQLFPVCRISSYYLTLPGHLILRCLCQVFLGVFVAVFRPPVIKRSLKLQSGDNGSFVSEDCDTTVRGPFPSPLVTRRNPLRITWSFFFYYPPRRESLKVPRAFLNVLI